MIAALWEQARAGFLLATGYRLNFALSLCGRLWWLVWVYFLAKLVPPDRIASAEMAQGYLAFALVGVAMQQYLSYVLVACSEKLREDQLNGLLPALLVTPGRPIVAIFGPLLWGVVDRALTVTLMLAIGGLALGIGFEGANWGAALLVLALTTLAVAAWGLLSACFTLIFKRGDPILLLAGIVGYVFSGAFFPVSVLPPWMQLVSAIYPHAHAISAARAALLLDAPVAALERPLVALGAFCAILTPLALWAFDVAVRHVRRTGSAAYY